MKKQFLDSGKIVGTHGIKGEVRIDPWCDSPEFLCAFKKLWLDENGTEFIEVKSRPHKNIALAKIKGVDTIEAAEKYRGKVVYINRDDINLAEGVHFVQDLIGLEVKDAGNGRVYGKISDVLRTGANDVYEIKDADGKTYLAPVINDVVKEINVNDGYVFPEMFEPVLNGSIIGRAQKSGVLEIVCHQLRDYAFDKHKRVDDTPYGGGMGMLMKAEPIALCFEDICKQIGKRPHFVYMSPQGKTLKQQRLRELADVENICILCGHYEGVDQRLLDEFIDEEISIGDYVLTGGEIPAMVFADALSRMVPGVLSNNECFTEESHFNGLLEYPQYTKPSVWRGKEVPEVLMSGHHANIEKWRKEKSIEVTALKRPEMLEEYNKK